MLHSVSDWYSLLRAGRLDAALGQLYGCESVAAQRSRYCVLLDRFRARFGERPEAALACAPGRTEISGNHTDHQRGRVLAAAVTLDCIAAAAPNDENRICIDSEGYAPILISLETLAPIPSEAGTPAALVRGVAAEMKALGLPIGGFDAVARSDVPAGAGLSSSAAFEVLMGVCMRALYGGADDPAMLAEAAQRAESAFFGKPCGGMDQLVSAAGGLVMIDFFDAGRPALERLDADPAALGLGLCLVNTGGSHAGLTEEYAAIPDDMRRVADYFGEDALALVEPARFYEALPALRERTSDLAVLRAMHFFDENARVLGQAEALRTGDAARFLALVRASGRSSFELLQNVCPTSRSERGLALALALTERFFLENGYKEAGWATRVHGGGFAGTIQTFLPLGAMPAYTAYMERAFGPNSCCRVRIRPAGGVCLPA